MKKILMASLILIHSLIFLSCDSDLNILFHSNYIPGIPPVPPVIIVIDQWTLLYDTAYVVDGSNTYAELTGYANYKKGVMYNDTFRLSPGNIRLDFSIRTGPDKNPAGADGFAFTVANSPTGSDFVDYVNNVNWGGCIGYGVVGGDCAIHYEVESFHIEFDTWWNSFEYDKYGIQMGQENHIAITRNGDPGFHWLYKSLSIEDNVWHTISIEIQGSNVRVLFDGWEIINHSIPGFSFKGGFMMFSGATGGAKNYHSVDDLVVYQ